MLDSKIETFLCVAEFKSYTAVAEHLHLTQPAITQHIHKLEAHYGCKLIDSTRRNVRLTAAGELLFEYLNLQRANERQFSALLRGTVETLRVGATLSIADYYLSASPIDRILTDGIPMNIMVGNTARLLSDLNSGILDCAFIEGLFDATLLETRIFCHPPFLPVVAVGHPLAGRTVTLEELHPYPLILREAHSGTREIFETWLRGQNDAIHSFTHTVELGSFVLIKQMVQRTQGITFLYEAVVRQELTDGVFCPLDLAGFHVAPSLRFVFRKGDPRQRTLESLFEEFQG